MLRSSFSCRPISPTITKLNVSFQFQTWPRVLDPSGGEGFKRGLGDFNDPHTPSLRPRKALPMGLQSRESKSMWSQPREPHPMWSQPRELQPNDISLFELLGIAFFKALFHRRVRGVNFFAEILMTGGFWLTPLCRVYSIYN